MNVSLRFDTVQAQASIRKFRDAAPWAIARAVNKSAESGKVRHARDIAKDMKMKVGAAKDAIELKEARPDRLVAQWSASLKRIPLIKLGAKGPEPSRGRGRGVTAKTRTRRYPNAFIATMPSGHRGVYTRRPSARTKRVPRPWGRSGLPIVELKGPSIGHIFDKHAPAAQERGNEQLVKNLRSELRFALKKSTQ